MVWINEEFITCITYTLLSKSCGPEVVYPLYIPFSDQPWRFLGGLEGLLDILHGDWVGHHQLILLVALPRFVSIAGKLFFHVYFLQLEEQPSEWLHGCLFANEFDV